MTPTRQKWHGHITGNLGGNSSPARADSTPHSLQEKRVWKWT